MDEDNLKDDRQSEWDIYECIDVDKYIEECPGDFETIERGNELWDNIVRAYGDAKKRTGKKTRIPEETEDIEELLYLEKEVFPVLLPAMEEVLRAATENDVLRYHKPQKFSGLDYLAELLWNCNPRHPERRESYTSLFGTSMFRECIAKHPRELYPLSWIYTDDEAATIIQRNVRGWLVRKRPEVQEMRDFWKDLKKEKEDNEWKLLEEYGADDSKGSVDQLLFRTELKSEVELKKFLAEIIQDEIRRKIQSGTA